MTNMPLWNTPLARMRSLLAAAMALGVLLLVVTTTHATSPKPQAHRGTAAGQSAASAVPAPPAGLQGPITLACSPNGPGVASAARPAGPQGPVGVNCTAGPTG